LTLFLPSFLGEGLEYLAEEAADLVDEYFTVDDYDDNEGNNGNTNAIIDGNGMFSFNAPQSEGGMNGAARAAMNFDFSSGGISSSLPIPPAASLAAAPSASLGRGVNNAPSWMQK
jgi:hypothetical protein